MTRNLLMIPLAAYGCVVIMLGCVMVTFVQVGEYLIPSWNGRYLVIASVIIALERLMSWRVVRRFSLLSKEWVLYLLAEWVLIVVSLKALFYSLNGWGHLIDDLPTWQLDFFNAFFEPNYLVDLFLIVVIWMIAGVFGDLISQLETDETVLIAEQESGLINERSIVHRRLGVLIFSIGGVLCLLASLIRANRSTWLGERVPLNNGILNILLYFLLALVLLSFTQFLMMQANWRLDRIEIQKNIASSWIISSLGLLFLTLIIVGLMPNNLAPNPLGAINFLINITIGLIFLVIFLFALPIYLVIALISILLGQQPPPLVPPAALSLPELQIPQSQENPVSWLDDLRVLIFWLAFLAIVSYALYFYFKQNKARLGWFKQTGLVVGIKKFWIWLLSFLGKTKEAIRTTISTGRNRLSSMNEKKRTSSPSGNFINVGRLSPRQKIQYYYLSMVRRGGEHGYPRQPWQTPTEYAHRLIDSLPEATKDIEIMNSQFLEARYSLHEISEEQVSLVSSSWDRIRRVLRSIFSE